VGKIKEHEMGGGHVERIGEKTKAYIVLWKNMKEVDLLEDPV
jgi:hypothetical protein